VLAGGRSSRFGSDKALFRVDGETLLERTARVCGEAGLVVHVVARHVREGAVDTLLEPDTPTRHPLLGVAAALAAAAAAGHASAVVLPVDLPGLTPAAVQRLASAAAPACARGQPLLAHLPVSVAATAAAAAAAAGPVRAWMAALGPTELDLGVLENLNRPR